MLQQAAARLHMLMSDQVVVGVEQKGTDLSSDVCVGTKEQMHNRAAV